VAWLPQLKAVFQLVVDAVSGMLYPAVSENTPVLVAYVSPVAELDNRLRAVVEKSEMVEAVVETVNTPDKTDRPVPVKSVILSAPKVRLVTVVDARVVVASVEVPVVVRRPAKKVLPVTDSLLPGVVVPIPTFPPSSTVRTSVPPSKRLRMSPVPFCVIVKSVEAEVVEIEPILSFRTIEVEATPPTVLELIASKAAGTVPSILRGVISSSASIVTPRYRV
jgi:hypothetical protein